MKKSVCILLTLLLVSALLSGCVTVMDPNLLPSGTAAAETAAPADPEAPAPAEAPAPEPTPAPTETPAPTAVPPTTRTVSGTVVSVDSNDLILNVGNGTTISFLLSHIADAGVRAGDEVMIEYEGDILSGPQVRSITITKAALSNIISGTVMTISGNQVFVQITSGEAFAFTVNSATEYAFAGDPVNPPVAVGDSVSVSYSGNLMSNAVATEIQVNALAPNRSSSSNRSSSGSSKDDSDQTNKHLTGYVVDMGSDFVKIRTDNNRTWTFRVNKHTQETGSYTLEVGSKIRVTYDGYASNSPAAKTIKVISPRPATPTPQPGTKHKTSGWVTSWGGMYMTLDTGFGCDTTYATRSGSGGVGSYVDITYYNEGGMAYATKIVFH